MTDETPQNPQPLQPEMPPVTPPTIAPAAPAPAPAPEPSVAPVVPTPAPVAPPVETPAAAPVVPAPATPVAAITPEPVAQKPNDETGLYYSVLTVGSELALLSSESPVRKRIFSYGKFFKRMQIVLMSGRTGQGLIEEGNVSVYPTNSSNKIMRYFDALGLGRAASDVEIVSSQDPFEIGLISWLIARRHKAPLHLQVHTDFLAPEYASHSLINRIRVIIASFLIPRAAHVRAVSKLVADSITMNYKLKSPVSILPIYIDLEKFKSAKITPNMGSRFMNFPKRVLVVSRLEAEKNVALAISAFKEGAPDNACLIILGEGSEYTVLERLVTKLGLDSRVFFEGFKDPAPYYALADILLVPSFYEGYGQVIIEALAAGKPVLSSDVGIARESGAIIAERSQFGAALKEWFANGPKTGTLANYPYPSMEDFVKKYCDDVAQSRRKEDLKAKAIAAIAPQTPAAGK